MTTAQTKPRPKAHEIFERVGDDARDELARPLSALAFSGLAAGLTMGLAGLGVAAATDLLGPSAFRSFLAVTLYPVGFVAVVIGRAQLFTENTLYPVVVVLDERRHLLRTARLWAVVFAANIAGVLAFSVLVTESAAVPPAIVSELAQLGRQTIAGSYSGTFWSGVVAGWLIALVAWLVSASSTTSGQFLVIWVLTFLVGVARLDHCIASAGEALAAVFQGDIGGGRFVAWLAVTTAGNIAGGVVIVALLNYAQVKSGEAE